MSVSKNQNGCPTIAIEFEGARDISRRKKPENQAENKKIIEKIEHK